MRARILAFSAGLLALFSAAAVAIPASEEIPGRLLVAGWNFGGDFAYYMEGSSDNIVPAAEIFTLGDIAPDSTRVTYSRTEGETSVPSSGHVWVANANGSDAVNLTETTGVGGVNCCSRWSPDGKKIAFHHSEPTEGQLPCAAGFHVWVMDSDGTNAHRVTAQGNAPTWFPRWSPNGYRLLCEEYGLGAITIGIDGTEKTFVPDVNGEDGEWSADGRKLVSSWIQEDTVDGHPGIWRQLRLANPDGSNPQVLVQQFIKDSDVLAHIDKYQFDTEEFDWFTNIRALAGPLTPAWSPTGDKIAFLAAMPFDPDGSDYRYQIEVWLYDLNTEALTQLTSDDNADISLSWNGDNTYAEHPEVAVDNTTVGFSEVTAQGLTTIIRDPAPPGIPSGFQFAGPFYEIATSAGFGGSVSVSMAYEDEDIASAAQDALSIYHYNETTESWEDVTASRDSANNVISCAAESLSLFGLALPIPEEQFPDVPPTGLGPAGLHPYWAYYEISACVDEGIVAGYEDGCYHPDRPVTRDQMAVYIARALAGGDESVPDHEGDPTFPDVLDGHWAYKHIEYCVENAVAAGYDDGYYHPQYQVTRDQMAVYIARAVAGGDGNVPEPTGGPTFPDVDTHFWAYPHVEYCVAGDIVRGYGDGNYHPEIVVSRDQMAVYVARAFGLM